MFLKQAASHFIKKNLTTVFNFLGKITPFQRENDQYYVYKHDVNLISVPIMAHKHCQTLPVIIVAGWPSGWSTVFSQFTTA